jgi:nucleotide-binding universal stress UspA family protein
MKTKTLNGGKVEEMPRAGNETTGLAKTDAAAKSQASPLHPRKILVPVDFSDCSAHALEYALALAAQFQARLVLLHVVEPAVLSDNYMSVSSILDDSNQALVEAGKERLQALGRKTAAGREPVETLVRLGRAHSEISDTARAMGVDLIVIATHGYKGLKHVLLGSTTERVVRHASCPVLVVR